MDFASRAPHKAQDELGADPLNKWWQLLTTKLAVTHRLASRGAPCAQQRQLWTDLAAMGCAMPAPPDKVGPQGSRSMKGILLLVTGKLSWWACTQQALLLSGICWDMLGPWQRGPSVS